MEVGREAKNGESLWVLLDNGKVKVRVGVIYAPQETRTKKEIINNMYKEIEHQINTAKKNNQNALEKKNGGKKYKKRKKHALEKINKTIKNGFLGLFFFKGKGGNRFWCGVGFQSVFFPIYVKFKKKKYF